jgi:hypothetical protein
MTAGDPICVMESIPPGDSLKIIPPVGVVWMIKNIYFGGAWELWRHSDSNLNILLGNGVYCGL